MRHISASGGFDPDPQWGSALDSTGGLRPPTQLETPNYQILENILLRLGAIGGHPSHQEVRDYYYKRFLMEYSVFQLDFGFRKHNGWAQAMVQYN